MAANFFSNPLDKPVESMKKCVCTRHGGFSKVALMAPRSDERPRLLSEHIGSEALCRLMVQNIRVY